MFCFFMLIFTKLIKNVFKKLFINTPRELLHKKIYERVEKMFSADVIQEVKKFCKIKMKMLYKKLRNLEK